MPSATVTITSKITGTSLIVPYSHADGLQIYPASHAKAGEPVIYRINKYQMLVNGTSKYEVIRFGLQNKGTYAATRVSDAGLTLGRTVHPTWVSGYSPHSFAGGPYAGAWRILPGKGFLVHEGADESLGQVGGSLGCVEVLAGKWSGFLTEVKTACGQDWPTIGKKGLMNLVIEAASSPTATLV
jgi:hypothetical protein